MAKSLTDKYATLSSQMDNVIGDANAEIMSLRDKLSGTYFTALWLLRLIDTIQACTSRRRT